MQRIKTGERAKCETALLACIMSSPETGLDIMRSEGFAYTLFDDKSLRLFCIKLEAAYKQGGSVDVPLMIASLESEASSAVAAAYAESGSYEPPRDCALEAIARLRELEALDKLRGQQESDSGAEQPKTAAERASELQKYLAGKRSE